MKFEETLIPGVWLITPESRTDERGSFTRTWCAREFAAHGIDFTVVQANVSLNHARGALRGLHFQKPPKPEAKLVRCARGALFDVAVDLRAKSPAFGRAYTVVLTPENGKLLYIPEGCAHGFQTLEDDTEATYLMGEYYDPDLTGGLSWNDPKLEIDWPVCPSEISKRDADPTPFDWRNSPF